MENTIKKILYEQVLLNESYPFIENGTRYNFTNKDGLHFQVDFFNQGNERYVRCYKTIEHGESELNTNDAFEILSTVSNITLDFIKKYHPYMILIKHNDTKKERELNYEPFSNKRALANKRFLERIIPDNYTYELKGSSSIITKKENINESIIRDETQWMWVSPENNIIPVPRLNHRGYIMRQYNDKEYGWDYDRVFDQALLDGWVRVIYEKFPDRYQNELSINGHSKERVKSVLKNLFFNLIRFGNNTVYLQYEKPSGYDKFSTFSSESKIDLVNFLEGN